MTLKLRTHAEINRELVHARNAGFLKEGIKLLSSGDRKQRAGHVSELTRRLLIAAAGRKVLRGNAGRVLEALSEMGEKHPRGGYGPKNTW